MDRRSQITKYIDTKQRGIEIGAWFNPLAPKREGFQCLTLDVFDAPTLKARALADPNIPDDSIDRIEEVDLLGNTTEIETLVCARGESGAFDYVVSSHNLEHIPNPLKFLRGCGNVLKRGGLVSMAVPDKRVCFDYFRPHSTLAGWIEAWTQGRERPSLAQHFDFESLLSEYRNGDFVSGSFALSYDPRYVVPETRVEAAYAGWTARAADADGPYQDAHCWTFTRSSLHLICADAHFLGLIPFEVVELCPTQGNEFFIHLKNTGYRTYDDAERNAHYARRAELLHAVQNELACNATDTFAMRAASQDSGAQSLDALQMALSESLAERSRMAAVAHDRENEIRRLTDRIEEQQRSIARLAGQLAHLHGHAARLEADLTALLRSTSWRISAPIRYLKTRITAGRRSHD